MFKFFKKLFFRKIAKVDVFSDKYLLYKCTNIMFSTKQRRRFLLEMLYQDKLLRRPNLSLSSLKVIEVPQIFDKYLERTKYYA